MTAWSPKSYILVQLNLIVQLGSKGNVFCSQLHVFITYIYTNRFLIKVHRSLSMEKVWVDGCVKHSGPVLISRVKPKVNGESF